MDEEDDDLYGSATPAQNQVYQQQDLQQAIKAEDDGDAMEEDDDDSDDDSDSDVDIITESKPQPKQELAPPPRPESAKIKIEAPPGRAGSAQQETVTTTSRGTIQGPPSGKNFPEVRGADIDVNGTPVYEPSGKPITEVLMEADAAWDEKPWRAPGSDPKDYFNYGFDEFSWQMYCERQKSLREFKGQVDQEGNSMMALLGGGPGAMSGVPSAPAGMDMQGMMDNPMMQQMMAQMMQQSGGDPNNMDPNMFMNAMNSYQSTPGMGMEGMQQPQQPQQQHGHRGGFGGRRGRRGGW